MPFEQHSQGDGRDHLPQTVHETLEGQPITEPLDREYSRNVSHGEKVSFALTKHLGTPPIQLLNYLTRSPSPSSNRRPIIRPLPEFVERATKLLSDIAYTDFATTIIFCFFISSARAADGEDTTNNLFSDLAPILTLFGEQVTKQFLSESMGWADNVLFALAPLGVLTGITSAIRVGGPAWLKAIIGRAREGRADVELELMSSNSLDVGEMWNGQTIVRVLGTPSIFQFIYSPRAKTGHPQHYIKKLQDPYGFFDRKASGSGIQPNLPEGDHQDTYHRPIELRRLLPSPVPNNSNEESNEEYPPNMSLNARGEPIAEREKWVWVLMGVSTQVAVLVYQCLITYHTSWKHLGLKQGNEPAISAFPLTATGTVALTFGMLICSFVVESASTETDWVRPARRTQVKVAWVQRGGTVGDQVFEPYLIFGHEGQQVIRTSHRCNEKMGIKLQYWVVLGTVVGIGGFVLQFSGLREMNWTATVVQLAATCFMTIVRSCVRRRMSREPTAIKVLEGHELDSMARTIAGCDGFQFVPEGSRRPENKPFVADDGLGDQVLSIRHHLGTLTGWPTDVQHIASVLCTAIERTMNALYTSDDIELGHQYLDADRMCWKLSLLTLIEAPPPKADADWFSRQIRRIRGSAPVGAVMPNPAEDGLRRGETTMKLTRSKLYGAWGPWVMDKWTRDWTKAVLSLSILRLKEEEQHDRTHQSDGTRVKVLRVWPRGIEQDHFRAWMGSEGVILKFRKLATILDRWKVPAYRVFGNLGDEREAAVVVMLSAVPTQTLLVQQMFSEFFSALAPFIKTISGTTRIRTPPDLNEDNPDTALSVYPKRWEIENSALTELVEMMCATGLGTRTEVLLSIMPHLERHAKLPVPLVKSGSLIGNSFRDHRHRMLRACNDWHILALEIKQLLATKPTSSARAFGTRLSKRILALATCESITSSDPVDHPIRLFLEWLERVSIQDLPPIPPGPEVSLQMLGFPEHAVSSLDEEQLRKVRALLTSCGPISRSIVGPEIELLRQSMDVTGEQDLVQLLRRAASDGYDSIVEALGDRGLDTAARDDSGESPLTIAASHGHDAVVRILFYREARAMTQVGALWNAARNGHISTVKLLLKLDTDGPSRDSRRAAALTLAAGNGHQRLVEALLTDGTGTLLADAIGSSEPCSTPTTIDRSKLLQIDNRLDRRVGDPLHLRSSFLKYPKDIASVIIAMRTPLQAAAEGGYLAIVDQLLASGAKINCPPGAYAGRTALQAAAGRGHLAVVDRLLEMGAEVNDPPGEWLGRTALQAAAGGGYLAVVNRLLEKGAEVNALPAEWLGRTALQAAAGGGYRAVLDRLLDQGAEVNAARATSFGGTALEEAAAGGQLDVVDHLLALGAHVGHLGSVSLEPAARGGHLAVVERLLEHGVEVNTPAGGFFNSTPLQSAAEGGHLAVVDCLLQKGAEVNAPLDLGSNTRTALQAAARGGHLAVVERLLQDGADVNAPASACNGRTALQAAAEGGHLAVIDRLLQKGADVNAPTADISKGRTALQAAAEGGHLAVVDRLLKIGADVNTRAAGSYKRTPLQAAAKHGHLAVVELLLKNGAEVNATSLYQRGGTALEEAAGGGHLSVVDHLLENGARVDDVNHRRTALQLALDGGNLAVVGRILENRTFTHGDPFSVDAERCWAMVVRLQQAGASLRSI